MPPVASPPEQEESKGNEAQVFMIKDIESELAQICEDLFDILDKHLIPSAASEVQDLDLDAILRNPHLRASLFHILHCST